MPNFETKIVSFANLISYKFPLFRRFLKPIYHKIFYDHFRKKRRQTFKKNALIALRKFDECLTNNGFEYTLAFGTLLGAIRDKGIIKHDLDIDTIVWADQDSSKLKECLESNGFILTRSFLIEEGKLGKEETYEYMSAPIDIFYMYPPIQKHPYCCAFKPVPGYPTPKISMIETGTVLARRLEFPLSKKIIRTSFEDMLLPIPENATEILEYIYGSHYMIPDPTWDAAKQGKKYTYYWPEKKAIYIGEL